jgi:hypothetical protein
VEGESKRARIYVPNLLACEPGQLWCDTTCSDGATDSDHCGWCRNDCPDNAVCASGWCECPEGWELCDDACVDLDKDPDNCGECGAVCGDEEACVGGVCTGDCAPGMLCDRTCVDPMTDRVNCGTCGNVCEGGVCTDGECDTSCAAPPLMGDCNPIDQCNCPGANRCEAVHGPYDEYGPEFCAPAGEVAAMGLCDESGPAMTCGPGLTCIWGSGGVRGAPAPPGPEPVAGTCRKWCLVGDGTGCDGAAGETCAAMTGQGIYGVCYPFPEMESCNGVDDDFDGSIDYLGMNMDPFNCGYCGNYCDSGSCLEGSCQVDCEAAFQTTCVDGTCADTRWNRYSCGDCPPTGAECPVNQTCHDGACAQGIVGDPCDDSLQCSDTGLVGGFCAPELWSMPIPGGYCTKVCDPTAPILDRCPAGSVCVSPDGAGLSFCLQTCDPGTPETCRQSQGYQCFLPPDAANSFCLPVGTDTYGT